MKKIENLMNLMNLMTPASPAMQQLWRKFPTIFCTGFQRRSNNSYNRLQPFSAVSIPFGLYNPFNRLTSMYETLEFNDLSRFVDWTNENIRFNSKYDESYFVQIISSIARLDFVRINVDEFKNSTVYQFMFVYRNYSNVGNLFGLNVTTYDDGLSYITNGRVYINDSSNILRFFSPRTDEINFDYTISFKFIHMFYDIDIPNREFLFDVMQIVVNRVIDYLTSLGFSCRLDLLDGLAEILIDTQSEETAFLLHNFLFNANWEECLKPLSGIISTAQIKSENNSSVKEIRLSSKVKNDLVIEILNNKSVILRLWLTSGLIVYVYNEDKTEIYDGWEFMPQMKCIYTNPKWNIEPIWEFKVYGLKQVFTVHDKHLPLMRLNLLRVDGFKINGIEYFFADPQYVEIPFQHLDSALWNKWILTQLTHGDQNDTNRH